MSAGEKGRFDVTYEVNLPDEMALGNFPDGVNLLLESDMPGPVKAVNTISNTHLGDRRLETISLSSYVELAEPLNPSWVASDLAHRARAEGLRVSLPHSNHAPMLGIGIIWEMNQRMGPITHFSALEAGLNWGVNTTLERKGQAHQSKLEDANDILAQHVLVLGGLMSVVFDIKKIPLPEDRLPHRLFLNMPSQNLELEAGWQEGDSFEAFVGIDYIIEELRDFVALANAPRQELLQSNIETDQAVMLSGASGTGKTKLLRALARALGDTDPTDVPFGNIVSGTVGEWAGKIDRIFEQAYKKPGRTVIIMDEIDGLIRNGNEESTSNITTVLKKQLEKIKEYPDVFFACATNNPEKLDGVLTVGKRIPLKLHISSPNDTEREQMLNHLLVAEPLRRMTFDDAHLVGDIVGAYNIEEIAKAFDGFTAGDMRTVLSGIGNKRYLRAKEQGETMTSGPTQAEILAAIQRARRGRS